MGTDVFALVTDWAPMVAAARADRGLGRYRRAAAPPPFATERHGAGGFGFLAAGQYLESSTT
jgi:hypothetical protein